MGDYKELAILIENAKSGNEKLIQALESILTTLEGLEGK